MRRCWPVVVMAVACAPGEPEETLPEPAALAAPSGDCPDLSTPGIKTFTSSGVERRVGIWFPEDKPADMPVVFAFHGLTAPGLFDVVDQFATVLDLPRWADQRDAVFVVPEADVYNLVIQDVLLWGIIDEDALAADLTLYDDLRACLVDELDADVGRVSAFGFSGGALWTTKLIMERADTLATAVPISGGLADLGVLIDYERPAVKLPVMLQDGGADDAWPAPQAPIIAFDEGTEVFRDGLAGDGHFVAHCRHTAGHTILQNYWDVARRWLLAHDYGATSPYATGDIAVPGLCETYGGE